MPTTDPVAKELKRISGKLMSAWALQVGFETRLNGLLPAIAAIPSGEIDRHFDSIVKGDGVRKMAMALIATEHLFHPSLHHRISEWLAGGSLPYRDRIIRAIGRFRLRAFAEQLSQFFTRQGSPDSMLTWTAALAAVPQLKSVENYKALCEVLRPENTWENRAIADALCAFPQFDAEPIYRKWFRESEVIDQVAACERYLAGKISAIESMSLNDKARVIWDCAERYAKYSKGEVFDFLLAHIDFDQTWFSSERHSLTIVCRGRVATKIIAQANGWWIDDFEATKEAYERQNRFIGSLWQSLREQPALAFQPNFPVAYDYSPKHRIHKAIRDLLASYDRVIEESSEHGFSLRGSSRGEELLLAMRKPHWRLVRLSKLEAEQLGSGTATALDLFFKFSSRGALVAFADQILLNANDLENKTSKRLIRKNERRS